MSREGSTERTHHTTTRCVNVQCMCLACQAESDEIGAPKGKFRAVKSQVLNVNDQSGTLYSTDAFDHLIEPHLCTVRNVFVWAQQTKFTQK